MIIPQISILQIDREQLESQSLHWGLFPKLAWVNLPTDIEAYESVLRKVSGRVDLWVHLEKFDPQLAIHCLNLGASGILVNEGQQDLPVDLPKEKLTLFRDDLQQDDAIEKGVIVSSSDPKSDRLAELEMARVDCLVKIEHLTTALMVDFFDRVLVSDREDGLWSTVIVDPIGIALGLAYSNRESLGYALENRVGTYWSRSRKGLWVKGQTSGATQHLINIRMDCDRDCIRFMVTQSPPGFCHLERHSCFGRERSIAEVIQRLENRISEADENSFTSKLASNPAILESKLLEESRELAEAAAGENSDEVTWEAADVLYFSIVAMLKHGVSLSDVYAELARRMNRVVRRGPGIKT
ncbi:MAG: phosphoribosyl-ATP diphosphatase [Planctomycetota bacterium]